MINKKIYIGFAIDMDGASHNKINSVGGIIPENHPQYEFYTKEMNTFLSGMDLLFNYFDKHKCQNAATWFINEAGFNTCDIYPEIIDTCAKLGEIGLHTHFDDIRLGGQRRYISQNKEDWFELGLKNPTIKISNILHKYSKQLIAFKAGCHLRNNEMFDSIGKLGYIYDTTMVYEDIVINPDGTPRFDDRDLKCGTLPFFIITKNKYRLLEIPEIRPSLEKVEKHIKNTPTGAPIFIRLQVHPFDVIINPNFLDNFDKVIQYCRQHGDVTFKNIKEMGEIFLDYRLTQFSNILLQQQKSFIQHDSYYQDRLKQAIFWQLPEQYIIKYIFNNFNDITMPIVDCFAGWGQIAMALRILQYQNIRVLEFDKGRIETGKKIANAENLNGITFIRDDFFKNQDILETKLFIGVNSVNGSLDKNSNKQHSIYQTIVNNNGTILVDISRYGTTKENGSNIFDSFVDKNKVNSNSLDLNFIRISKINNNITVKPKLSSFFQKMYSISSENITINEILDTKNTLNDLLSTNIIFNNNEIKSSAGIYFSFPISFLAKYNYYLPIQKYQFTFNARINKSNQDFKFKIYTGIKYITLKQEVTEEYQQFILIDDFNFNKASTYRIGFVNPKKDIELFINDPLITII